MFDLWPKTKPIVSRIIIGENWPYNTVLPTLCSGKRVSTGRTAGSIMQMGIRDSITIRDNSHHTNNAWKGNVLEKFFSVLDGVNRLSYSILLLHLHFSLFLLIAVI
ncbi:hypothetical protein O6H91_21G006800 [Diphasiastrum complanatum]|uniref:Uncharacterized protein n=1 Tax=Diphasiastrum complanatum TaxID=34168 RepID=A0ACC2AHD8_DIPCM|nr:hypothetical protein O6H91_21G006800 [Diphasiastrum complanatum]